MWIYNHYFYTSKRQLCIIKQQAVNANQNLFIFKYAAQMNKNLPKSMLVLITCCRFLKSMDLSAPQLIILY